MTTTDSLAPVPPLATVEFVCRHAHDSDLVGMRDIVQLISDFADCSMTPFWSLPRASERSDLRLMQRLAARESPIMDEHHRAFLFNEALMHAVKAAACRKEGAKENSMAMIEWLCTSYYPRAFVTKGMTEVARYDDLEIMDAAAAGGHVRVLEWLHTRGVLSSQWIHDALPKACANGDRASVQFLLSLGANSYEMSMCRAAASGNFDIVKLLVDASEPRAYSAIDAMFSAAGSNELAILEWLSSSKLSAASVPLLLSHTACNGHLAIVQFLHTICSESCTTRPMDDAARLGHLDMLEWLHINCSAGCTTQAMDGAAQNGHLDVVKWLHEHRNEGCTMQAMTDAAIFGHLDVVQWLHAWYSNDCKPNASALILAIGSDHLDVVKWLYNTFEHLDLPSDAIDAACSLKMLEWLCAHGVNSCTSRALDNAVLRNNFDKLAFVRTHFPDVACSRQCPLLVVSYDGIEAFLWLHTHFPEVVDLLQARRLHHEYHWTQVFDIAEHTRSSRKRRRS